LVAYDDDMLNRWRRLSSAQQGFIVAAVILVAWFAFWFLAYPGGNATGPEYVEGDTEAADEAIESMRPWIVWVGAALIGFAVIAGWSMVHLWRERGVKFEDLDVEEQHRREEAGRMLHDLGQPQSGQLDRQE
jgi:hypothetical protein